MGREGPAIPWCMGHIASLSSLLSTSQTIGASHFLCVRYMVLSAGNIGANTSPPSGSICSGGEDREKTDCGKEVCHGE